MIDFVSSVTVNSTNYPSAYPTDYLQETIITSGGVTEFTITFLEPFTVDEGDLLCIKFDDGTELHYSDVSQAPDPVEKNATKITIQFSTDEDDEGPGFSLYIAGGEPEPEPELTCTSEGETNIRINDDTLTALSCSDPGDYVYVSPTPVEDLDTLDPACVANSSYPSFDLSLNNCTIVQQTDGVLTVISSVRCQQNLTTSASILRYQYNCINLTCEYNITELLSTSAILPKIIKKRLDAIKEMGSFVVKLIFTDDTYAVELPSNYVVTVPNYVHAKAEMVTSENNSSFFVQVTRCWATRGVQSSEPSYSIIVQSCEDPSSFDPVDAIQIDRNYEADYSTFRFRSFVWTDALEEAIYLHCEVIICLNSEEEPCPSRPTCDKKRRRRDLFSAGPRSRVISSGPLRVQQKEKESCEKKNGGCSDLCEMRSVEVMCLCNEGRELEGDGKSCHDKTSEVVEILEVNKQFTALHVVAIIAISICGLGLFLKLKGNRKNEHAAA
ncbi:uncharacterized protein LOC143446021 [Clavelina lepadiformis]|uniref:uncharacterized protein LOC143446021 n=1 Tax=Clavelina lepadiformis TaxID=159417 RepID=UPI0040426164